jgi:hypothetical protein
MPLNVWIVAWARDLDWNLESRMSGYLIEEAFLVKEFTIVFCLFFLLGICIDLV